MDTSIQEIIVGLIGLVIVFVLIMKIYKHFRKQDCKTVCDDCPGCALKELKEKTRI